jgi:hypothetical protein
MAGVRQCAQAGRPQELRTPPPREGRRGRPRGECQEADGPELERETQPIVVTAPLVYETAIDAVEEEEPLQSRAGPRPANLPYAATCSLLRNSTPCSPVATWTVAGSRR